MGYIQISKAFAACALGAFSLCGAGCGLFKQDDARNPTSRGLRPLTLQSGLSRSSGEATRVRLAYLFPEATTVLAKKDFSFEGADGINRAFGSETRPTDALAQMALRKKVAALCDNNLADTSNQIFRLDTGNQLLDGETPPSSPAARIAVAAARNVWLHPYVEGDPEVQELISLYNDISKLSPSTAGEGGEVGARRAVCQATLLSPQFWVGTSEVDDAAKRVALELFRRVPKMQELQDFIDKKTSIDAYFDRLLADTTAKGGFVGAINSWHEKWLGFRDFFEPSSLYSDPRPNQVDHPMGASNEMALPYTIDARVTSAASQTIVSTRYAITASAASCTSNAAQAFDPDTKMIAWEHYNFEASRYDFTGGFIRVGANLVDSGATAGNMSLSDASNALSALGLLSISNSAARIQALRDACASQTSVPDQEGVLWKSCDGFISLGATSAARVAQTFTRLLGWIYAFDGFSRLSDVSRFPMENWCGKFSGAAQADCVARHQTLARNARNGLIDDLIASSGKIRSYSTNAVLVNRLKSSLNALGTANIYDAFIARFQDYASVSVAPAQYRVAPWSVSGPYNGDINNDGTTIETDGMQIQAGPRLNDLRDDIRGGGWYYLVSLSENKAPNLLGAGTAGEERFNYNAGPLHTFVANTNFGLDKGFKPLPIEDPSTTLGGWARDNRHVHRLGGTTNTWQDGYSTVRLWATGGSVAVCNNADRLWASCFYRPSAIKIQSGLAPSYRADQGKYWVASYMWMPDSAMHPQVSSAFYCGLPSPDALQVRNSTTPNAPFSAVKYTQLNTVATNIDLQLNSGVAAGTVLGNEATLFNEQHVQIREEPFKLIDRLVLDRGDYRQLLTAPYTYGNSCLKLLYDTQAFYLPSHNEAAGQICRGPGGADSQFSAGASIPIGNITSVEGAYQGDTATRGRMWNKVYGGAPSAIPPRLYSGILTMPAFLAPVATTARGMAARYFSRILCDLPSFYDPAQDPVDGSAKTALHQSFVSERKHLAPACIQCHRNLDPLASALSWTFQGLLTRGADGFASNSIGGEGSLDDYLGEIDAVPAKLASLAGIRNGVAPPSSGAFMGQAVSGIADLGRKISNSERFAACSTQIAFENVFGRSVQFSDQALFKNLVEQFRDPTKANYRYIDLIKAMIKSDAYQRKN